MKFYSFFLLKPSTSNCQAKCDAVENDEHHRLPISRHSKMFMLKMLFNFQKNWLHVTVDDVTVTF